jgi:hypothetical protein
MRGVDLGVTAGVVREVNPGVTPEVAPDVRLLVAAGDAPGVAPGVTQAVIPWLGVVRLPFAGGLSSLLFWLKPKTASKTAAKSKAANFDNGFCLLMAISLEEFCFYSTMIAVTWTGPEAPVRRRLLNS